MWEADLGSAGERWEVMGWKWEMGRAVKREDGWGEVEVYRILLACGNIAPLFNQKRSVSSLAVCF